MADAVRVASRWLVMPMPISVSVYSPAVPRGGVGGESSRSFRFEERGEPARTAWFGPEGMLAR